MIIKVGIKMREYRSHAHLTSSCKYHFVWCPKYRHPVLGLVKDEVAELFMETADHFGHEILALEIADDHVHLFVLIQNTVRLMLLDNSSHTLESTSSNSVLKSVSRTSGAVDSGR